MDDEGTEPWLSANDNAAHLGITKVAIYSWSAEKNMSANKLGHLWKFQATENDGWVRSCGAATEKSTPADKDRTRRRYPHGCLRLRVS